jgi:hypothetical protein
MENESAKKVRKASHKPKAGTGAGGPWPRRCWLEDIDAAVDWSKFERFLRWLEADREELGGQPALVIFKAMLLQQWHALIAYEFDRELEDRLSFRRFVGIGMEALAPGHDEVCAFRRLIVERGIAADIFGELQRQLDGAEPFDADGRDDSQGDGKGDRLGGYYSLASDYQLFRPPLWVSLEADFIAYWRGLERHNGRATVDRLEAGSITEGNASGIPPGIPASLRRHIVLVRPLAADDFQFDFVGDDIVAANQGPLVGYRLGLKAQRNLREYGHEGLPGQLLGCCRTALLRGEPVGLSTYQLNALGRRCYNWTLVAPLHERHSGQDFVLAVSLIAEVDPATLLRPLSGDPEAKLPDLWRAPSGPAEWVEVEERFLEFWQTKRAGRRAPTTSDIQLKELKGFEAHLTLIGLTADGGLQYELVGPAVEQANGASLVGLTIEAKARTNHERHGHAGLQGELAAMLERAARRIQPVRLSTYFMNAAGQRCQIWTVHAPLANDEGEVCKFLGLALIKPLKLN